LHSKFAPIEKEGPNTQPLRVENQITIKV